MGLIGEFESLLLLSTSLTFFWVNSFLQTFLIQYPSVPESEKGIFLSTIFLIFNALSFLGLLLVNFLAISHHALLFSFFLFFNTSPLLLESFWTSKNDPLSILIFSMLSNLLLPLVALPLFFGENIESVLWVMLLLAIFRYIVLIINILRTTKQFDFSKKMAVDFFKKSTPLVGYSILGGFVMIYASWLITYKYGVDKSQLALFRYGAREFPLALALATGLSGATAADLAMRKRQSEADFTEGVLILKRKSERLWHIVFPLSFVLLFSSNWLFATIFNPDFASSAPVFDVFLLIVVSRVLFPQSILLGLGDTNATFWAGLVEIIVLIPLSWVGISYGGIFGLSCAIAISFLCEKIVMVNYLQKKYSIDFQLYTNLFWYLVYVFILILIFVLKY